VWFPSRNNPKTPAPPNLVFITCDCLAESRRWHCVGFRLGGESSGVLQVGILIRMKKAGTVRPQLLPKRLFYEPLLVGSRRAGTP
jgi:hypothetical protein